MSQNLLYAAVAIGALRVNMRKFVLPQAMKDLTS